MNNSTSRFDNEWAVTYTFLRNYAFAEIALAPLIIISNIVLIVSILYKRELRHEFRYLSIVSIAVSDLLIGIFSTPLGVDIIFKDPYYHGCAVHLIVTVFVFYVHFFVSTWTIVTINTDYMLKMCYIRTPYLTPQRRRVLFAVILSLPWLAMLFIGLPVAFAYSTFIMMNNYCYFYHNVPGYILVSSLVYIVPAALILIQVVVMTVVRLYRRNCATRIPATATTVDISPPWVLVAASAVTVLFIFPEEINWVISILGQMKIPRKDKLVILLTAEVTADSKSAVLPVVWFFYSDIRASFCELFNTLPCRRTVNVKSDFKVSYKEFSDEAPESCEISI